MLDKRKIVPKEERTSQKDPLTPADVAALLKAVKTVVIAKGKKSESHPAAAVTPEMLKGPTGNFRAPMLRKGTTLLVGFNAEVLGAFLG